MPDLILKQITSLNYFDRWLTAVHRFEAKLGYDF